MDEMSELNTEDAKSTEGAERGVGVDLDGLAIDAAEVERLREENGRLRAEVRMRAAVYELEAGLAAAGATSPRLLVEAAKEMFEYAEGGKVANAGERLGRLRASYPEQFGQGGGRRGRLPSIDAGAGYPGDDVLTREQLAAMSPAEIARLNWEDVKAALAR